MKMSKIAQKRATGATNNMLATPVRAMYDNQSDGALNKPIVPAGQVKYIFANKTHDQ